MAFWRRGPSVQEQLLALLRDQQQSQAAQSQAVVQQMARLVDAATEQAKLVQGWITLFTTASKPEVRVMGDYDEALKEAERRAVRRKTEPPIEPFQPGNTIDPQSWLSDLTRDIEQGHLV